MIHVWSYRSIESLSATDRRDRRTRGREEEEKKGKERRRIPVMLQTMISDTIVKSQYNTSGPVPGPFLCMGWWSSMLSFFLSQIGPFSALFKARSEPVGKSGSIPAFLVVGWRGLPPPKVLKQELPITKSDSA